MNFLRAAIAGFMLLFSMPAQAGSDVSHASVNWLSMIDAGRYDESWSHSSTLLRLQQTPDQWQARMRRLRDAFGNLSMRSVTGVSFFKSSPGNPDGSYATVRFQSSFFRQRNATETVTLRLEGDRWRIVSYVVR